jgi:hypothetical protein
MALCSDEAVVQLNDVRTPNGQVLHFQVRLGSSATSRKMPVPPESKMIQVNLANDNTRVVEVFGRP